MIEFLGQYALFFLKTLTLIVGTVLVLVAFFGLLARYKSQPAEQLEIESLNEKLKFLKEAILEEILPKSAWKAYQKKQKKEEKKQAKNEEEKKRLFVIDFDGDLRAEETINLRELITAILMIATANDEVLVRLESPGGLVANYGLAASQLARLRVANIPLTVAVDKIAASGGYLMAAVANRILAAPFAIIGSIGVIGQLPNFHKILKKHDIDFEQHTAGDYKRTLTVFGENTPEARKKFQEELEEIHGLFKTFITQYRPELELAKVATGEHWCAMTALALKLVDEIKTSDDYLLSQHDTADIYHVSYTRPKNWVEKMTHSVSAVFTAIKEQSWKL